jgi:hypothetical protein
MRARKVKLPLTLDTLLSTLVPGRPYTLQRLNLIYEGGAPAISAMLRKAIDTGAMEASANDREYNRRIRYWVKPDTKPGITTRRTQPAEMQGQLTGYDLMSLARLSNTFRRQ